MKDKAVKILRGNQVTIALPLERLVISSTGQVVEEYIPDPDDEIMVNVRERQTFRYVPTIEDNVATFVLGADVPCGVYGVEVLITKADGTRLRSYRLSQIAIVENNERAGLSEGVEFGVDSVQLDAAAYIFAKGDKGDPFTYEDFTDEQLDDLAERIELTPAELAEIAEQVDLSGYVNGGAYDSQTKRILLTHDNVVVSSIDATAFIKDGMVSGVVVDNGYIVITFNTDAGKEDIRIPVSEVFDASLYFTKTESDARFVGKPFKVTLSSREEGGKTVWSADKTFAEILAAYQAGRDIVAIYDGAEVALNQYLGGSFIFALHYGNGVQEVFISESEIGVTLLTFVEENNVATINSQSLTRGGNITLPTPTDITALQQALANYCPIIEDTRSSNVAAITGVAPFSELRDGQRILLHLINGCPNSATLSLTLADGATTTNIPIFIVHGRGIGRTTYADAPAGTYLPLLYEQTSNRWVECGKDFDIVYSAITQALINAGTATGGFLISPKLLVDNFEKRTQVVSVDNQSAQVEQALESNKFYKFLNPVDELTLSLVAPTGYGDVMGIYAGKFTASSTWDSLVLPASVSIASGAPTITAGGTYEFNICDNILMLSEI